jgi:hypothetical protein
MVVKVEFGYVKTRIQKPELDRLLCAQRQVGNGKRIIRHVVHRPPSVGKAGVVADQEAEPLAALFLRICCKTRAGGSGRVRR